MTVDQSTTGQESDVPIRTDGGSSMPGVPSDESADAEGDESEQEGGAGGGGTTSSGSKMPGVPNSNGPEPSVNSGGDSRKTHEHETADSETHDTADGETQAADDGETHDLTTAFTLSALASTQDPASVIQDARAWSDWVGVVGRVDAPQMNTFLRRNNVDVDFFNGAKDPESRLDRVASEGSTFYSDRLVLVGVEGESDFGPHDEWEFELLEPTAEKAGWTLQ